MKLQLASMSFYKDFINDRRGDLYPLIESSQGCDESVFQNAYTVSFGQAKRLFCGFFPFASYYLRANVKNGYAGFCFALPNAQASFLLYADKLVYECGDQKCEFAINTDRTDDIKMIISCRPSAFDVYFERFDKAEFFCTVNEQSFEDSNLQNVFENSKVFVTLANKATLFDVRSYIDSGIAVADIRPIRYENGEVMVQNGKIYFSASIRMQAGAFQGIFSWIPTTSELELTGALFYDAGDFRWCGDVAASILYHREKELWYLWVCSFSHGHVLAHSAFEGDIRFGVNVVDVKLMEKASIGADISRFLAFGGDEDPDFFYDKEKNKWFMAICRLDAATKAYKYVFFESDEPFDNYKFIGKGYDGAETGGSFVKIDGEQYFVCGNDFKSVSDYRIYHKGGMTKAKFDFVDGGFRGWGTVIPIKMGSRTRYFWLTFDRQKGSDYNWSYGNFYCFEAT